jgi:Alcohol dehydrogenase GroES-like domain
MCVQGVYQRNWMYASCTSQNFSATTQREHEEDVMALTMPAHLEQDTLPQIMRAAVLFGPQDIRVIERPVPQPGPGEVLVQVAMCGTCGSDLKIYDGHFPLTLPFGAFTPGHEWTGTVVALGETVDESPWATGSVLKHITAADGVITVSLAGTLRV